jgi:hypothetical protein
MVGTTASAAGAATAQGNASALSSRPRRRRTGEARDGAERQHVEPKGGDAAVLAAGGSARKEQHRDEADEIAREIAAAGRSRRITMPCAERPSPRARARDAFARHEVEKNGIASGTILRHTHSPRASSSRRRPALKCAASTSPAEWPELVRAKRPAWRRALEQRKSRTAAPIKLRSTGHRIDPSLMKMTAWGKQTRRTGDGGDERGGERGLTERREDKKRRHAGRETRSRPV